MLNARQLILGGFADDSHVAAEEGHNPVFDNVVASDDGKALEAVRGYARAGAYRFVHDRSNAAAPNWENRHRLMQASPWDLFRKKRGRLYVIADNQTGELVHAFHHPGGDSYPETPYTANEPYPPHEVLMGRALIDSGEAAMTEVDTNKAVLGSGSQSLDGKAHSFSLKSGAAAGNLFYLNKAFTITDDEFDARTLLSVWMFNGGDLPLAANALSLVVATSTALGGTAVELPIPEVLHPKIWQNVVLEWDNGGDSFTGASLGLKLANAIDTSRFDSNSRLEIGMDRLEWGRMVELCRQHENETFSSATIDGGETVYFGNARNRLWQVKGSTVRRASVPAPHLPPIPSIGDTAPGTIEDGSTAGNWTDQQSTYITTAAKSSPSATTLASDGASWATLQSGRCTPSDASASPTSPDGGNYLRLLFNIVASTSTVFDDGTNTWATSNADVTVSNNQATNPHDGNYTKLERTEYTGAAIGPESGELIAYADVGLQKEANEEVRFWLYMPDVEGLGSDDDPAATATTSKARHVLEQLIVKLSSNTGGDFSDAASGTTRFAYIRPVSASVEWDTWIECTLASTPYHRYYAPTGTDDAFKNATIDFNSIGIFRHDPQAGGSADLGALEYRIDDWRTVPVVPAVTTNLAQGGLAYKDVSGTLTSGAFINMRARYDQAAPKKLDLSSGYLKLRFHDAIGGGGNVVAEFPVKADFDSDQWQTLAAIGPVTASVTYASISFALDGDVFPTTAYDLSDPTDSTPEFSLMFDTIQWGQQYTALNGNSLEVRFQKVSDVGPATGVLTYLNFPSGFTLSPGDTFNLSAYLVSSGTTNQAKIPGQTFRIDLYDTVDLGGTRINTTADGLWPPYGSTLIGGEWDKYSVQRVATDEGFTAQTVRCVALSLAKSLPDDLYDSDGTTPTFYLYIDGFVKAAASGSVAEKNEFRFGFRWMNPDDAIFDVSPPSPLSSWITIDDGASADLDLLGKVPVDLAAAGNRNPDTSRYTKIEVFGTTKDLGDDEFTGLPNVRQVAVLDAPDFSSTTTVTLNANSILTNALKDQPKVNIAEAEPPPMKVMTAHGQRLVGGGAEPYACGRIALANGKPHAFIDLTSISSDYATGTSKNMPEGVADWMRGAELHLEGVDEVYEVLAIFPLDASILPAVDNMRVLMVGRYVPGESGELELKYFNGNGGLYKYRIEHPATQARWSYTNGYLHKPWSFPLPNQFDLATNDGIKAMRVVGDRLNVQGDTWATSVVQNIVSDDDASGGGAYDQPSAQDLVSLGAHRAFVPLGERRAAMLDNSGRLIISNGEDSVEHPLGRRVRRWLMSGDNVSTRDLAHAHGVWHAPTDRLALFFMSPETETLVSPGALGADERGLIRADPQSTIASGTRSVTYDRGVVFDLRHDLVSTLTGFPFRSVIPTHADQVGLGDEPGKLIALGCDGFIYDLWGQGMYARGPWSGVSKYTVTTGDANSVTVGGFVKDEDGNLIPAGFPMYGESCAQMEAVLVKKAGDGTVSSVQKRPILYNTASKAYVYDSVLSEGTAWTSNPADGDELYIGRILADVQWPTRKFIHPGFMASVQMSIENEIDAGRSAALKQAFPDYWEADALVYTASDGEIDAIDNSATFTQALSEAEMKAFREGVPLCELPSYAAALRLQWPAKDWGVIRLTGVTVYEAESEVMA